MTFIAKQVVQFLRLLHSDTDPTPIAAAIVLGMFLGFSPGFSLLTLLVWICVFFFRVQLGAAALAALLFKVPAYFLDPWFHYVGKDILEMDELRAVFTSLYEMPLIPLTRFNNSIVMGALLFSMIFSVPMFLLSKILVTKYRSTVVAKWNDSALAKFTRASKIYKWYQRYESLTS